MTRGSILLIAIALCFGIAACDLTLGPKVKTKLIVMRPGKPFHILENRKVRGRLLNEGGDTVAQDVGGWVAMPLDHWEAIKRTLQRAENN